MDHVVEHGVSAQSISLRRRSLEFFGGGPTEQALDGLARQVELDVEQHALVDRRELQRDGHGVGGPLGTGGRP